MVSSEIGYKEVILSITFVIKQKEFKSYITFNRNKTLHKTKRPNFTFSGAKSGAIFLIY
jgi:hypothetical protein